MEFLANLYLPGAVPMWCAVVFALASLWGYTLAVGGDQESIPFARRGYLFFALSIALACVVLLIALARRDFRIEYVYQYSGMDLADHFQMAAFWAGQKGSFLIWLFWAVLLGIPVARTAGRDEAPTMWFYILSLGGLLLILAKNNPFVMLPETPVDGAGLNPLLQDDWMVIHPPVMFIGYAAAAIPYAFAMGALWKGDTSRWAARAFPWTLAGFLVLGTAILMGGYWAYKTLGWGGYWGWDPVENASLIPWLIGVVLIHGMYLERTRKRYRRMNLVLACLLFWSVLYGTFLTRSGVLADFSVHSFVDLGLSAWLVGIMALHGFLSLGLLAYRWRSIPTEPNVDPWFSRGTFLVLATVAVGLSTILVAIGTSSPLITRWFMDNPAQVGPEFYNTVHAPIALLITVLLIAIPFMTWRGYQTHLWKKKLVPTLVPALVAAGVVMLVLRVEEFMHAAILTLAFWAVTANLSKVIDMWRGSRPTFTGGYLAHVGVGVMMVGVLSSSAYDQSAKVTLPQGEAVAVDDLELTFERFIPRQGREKERMEVKVVRADGSTYFSYPKLFVNDRTRQLMANPHVKTTPFQDLYISPIQYEPAEPLKVDERLALGKGESARVGEASIRFVDFEMAGHDPAVQLASGGVVEVAARLEVTQGGETRPVKAIYRFRSDGMVESPAAALPGQGAVRMVAIDPATGRAQLDVATTNAGPQPARLSIDVTRKPLIQLVWFGLYIILAGGGLSTWKRFRSSGQLDEVEDRIAAARNTEPHAAVSEPATEVDADPAEPSPARSGTESAPDSNVPDSSAPDSIDERSTSA